MHGQANIRQGNYLLIKYIKSVLWRVAKRLSYIQEAWCLKVKESPEMKHDSNRLTNEMESDMLNYFVYHNMPDI